ncbi:MAG: hypothetical protein ACE5LQ_03325 [Candidatus Bipolaricaulia bacterium]
MATEHERIFIAKLNPGPEGEELMEYLGRLERLTAAGAHGEIIALLREMVPTYRPSGGETSSKL